MVVLVVVGSPSLAPSHTGRAATAAAPHHRAQLGQEARLQNSYVRVFVCKTIQRLLGTTRGVHQEIAQKGEFLETGSGVSLSSYQCRKSLTGPPRVPRRGRAAAQPPLPGPGAAQPRPRLVRCIAGMFKYTIDTDINVLKS